MEGCAPSCAAMFRFRLFRVPFEVTGSFWIAAVLLGGIGSDFNSREQIIRLVIWVACVFVSIVVHELGHALVGRFYGGEPYVILQGMGGLTYRSGPPVSRPKSIAISLAGPAFGFALFVCVWAGRNYVFDAQPAWLERRDGGAMALLTAIQYLIFINGFWTLFNLLPILPMDGGRVCEDVLGPSRVRTTRMIGAVVAAVLCGLAAWAWQPFIAIFLGYLAYANFTGKTHTLL